MNMTEPFMTAREKLANDPARLEGFDACYRCFSSHLLDIVAHNDRMAEILRRIRHLYRSDRFAAIAKNSDLAREIEQCLDREERKL